MLRIIGLASMALLSATGARAQSADAIRAHIARANPGCDIYRPEETYRGPLPGAPGPVVVVVYTLEGCGGGNDWNRVFGVFYGQDGRVTEVPQPHPPSFMVDAATVTHGAIEVNGLAYGPRDPRCCPSQRRRERFRLVDGAMAPAR